MIIVGGILLLTAAIIFGAEFVFANHHHFLDPRIFGRPLGIHSDAGLFMVGVITGAGLLIALGLKSVA